MKYDVVIVGGGTAGAVLASRLSEDGARTVALLEAGPDYPDPDKAPDDIRLLEGLPYYLNVPGLADASVIPHDWNLSAHAAEGESRRMRLPRGKVMGGSGSINGSMFVRGTPEDFASWVSEGNEAWSFEKVLPYYCRLERDLDFFDEFHGDSGPIPVMRMPRDRWESIDHAFAEASSSLGYPYTADHNRPGATGVGPIPRNSLDKRRMSTARAYLVSARRRTNLTIMPNCLAQRVLFRGTRAVGVQVERFGRQEIVNAREIVLCAGAIGSPHLLMLSGVGPAALLRTVGVPVVHDLQGVGRNLRDHPKVLMFWQRRQRAASSGLSVAPQTFLRFTAANSPIDNDCRIMFFPSPPSAELSGSESMQLALYSAAGSGEVSLISPDPRVPPEIDFCYLSKEADRVRFRELIEIATELGTRQSLRLLLRDRLSPNNQEASTPSSIDTWIRRNVCTSHHATSTAKMGPQSDPNAVVDQYGCVHGLEALRVADASIMPYCVGQNPNCTVIMIAERVADFMRGATAAT